MRESTGRALRIAELKQIIELAMQQGRAIDRKKLISQLSLKWNVAVRKVQEYLKLLIDTEFVIETPEGLQTPVAAEADKLLENAKPKENEKQ